MSFFLILIKERLLLSPSLPSQELLLQFILVFLRFRWVELYSTGTPFFRNFFAYGKVEPLDVIVLQYYQFDHHWVTMSVDFIIFCRFCFCCSCLITTFYIRKNSSELSARMLDCISWGFCSNFVPIFRFSRNSQHFSSHWEWRLYLIPAAVETCRLLNLVMNSYHVTSKSIHLMMAYVNHPCQWLPLLVQVYFSSPYECFSCHCVISLQMHSLLQNL